MLGGAPLRVDRAMHLTRHLDREPTHMRDVVDRNDWRGKKVEDWLLAILRFAVTLRDEDRSTVLVAAEEIDRLGMRSEEQSEFEFFRNTSIEICSAIVEKHNSRGSAVLRLHLNRIEDCRLRRAFAAAVKFGDSSQTIKSASKFRKRGGQDLWKGLRPPRDD